MKCHFLSALCALSAFAATAWPADLAGGKLHLQYGDKKVDLTAVEFAKLPQTEVEGADQAGPHHYRGVTLHDLLRLVDAPPGERLRRPSLCLVARVKGADGLVCAFALAEFEEGFTDRTILLASHQDGAPLSADLGPWRLIAPKDTRVARWVRQTVSIEVISIENDAGTGAMAQPDTAAPRVDDHLKFVPKK
jgi:hypothetical protein